MNSIGAVSKEEVNFFKSVPKVHIHSHILGMVSANTVLELAEKNHVEIRSNNINEMYKYYDFKQFVEILSDIASVIQTEEDYSRVIYECIENAYKNENVLYSELFIQTSYHFLYGSSYQKIIDGFTDGIIRAEQDYGVKCRLILGLNRQLPAPMATHIVRQAITYPSKYVIGIGLEDFEGFGPPEDFKDAYTLAKAHGLHCTAHAGEHGSPQNVITALTQLGCERIDHGYQAMTDASIAYRLAQSQVHFTTCPTVASRQGWLTPQGHIIKQMHDYGLWLSINTDDPAIVGTDLNQEYALAAKYMNADHTEMIEIAERTIEATWLSQQEKADLHSKFKKYLKSSK